MLWIFIFFLRLKLLMVTLLIYLQIFVTLSFNNIWKGTLWTFFLSSRNPYTDVTMIGSLHFQVFCTKRKPNCNACPMRGECKYFASAFARFASHFLLKLFPVIEAYTSTDITLFLLTLLYLLLFYGYKLFTAKIRQLLDYLKITNANRNIVQIYVARLQLLFVCIAYTLIHVDKCTRVIYSHKI